MITQSSIKKLPSLLIQNLREKKLITLAKSFNKHRKFKITSSFAISTNILIYFTEMAKPPTSSSINQSLVWVILALFAIGLQIISQLLEKNENIFPAIAKTSRLQKKVVF